jgi:hypothetical protein
MILALLVCVAVITATVALCWEREPTYNGKALSQWLAGGEDERVAWLLTDPNRPDTRDAVLHIGTNAFPCLLRWIRYSPPAWRQTFDKRLGGVWPWYESRVLRAEGRMQLGVMGFRVLGPRGAPAIPDLARLLRNPGRKKIDDPALDALTAIGKDSLPALFAVLGDPKQQERYKIAWAIRQISLAEGFDDTYELEKRLNDPNLDMRVAVTNAMLWVNGASWTPF